MPSGKNTPLLTTNETELYFLIAKFLSTGPCQTTSKVLLEEIEKHELLPSAKDWMGNKRSLTFHHLAEHHPHIQSDHLLQVCERLRDLVEKEFPPVVSGIKSFLGAGCHSLLRNKFTTSKVRWKCSKFFASSNGHSVVSPSTLETPSNFVGRFNCLQTRGSFTPQQYISPEIFAKMNRVFRVLGHLCAVYCLTFDRTAMYLITGADDHLIKIWSVLNGHLLRTMRGHTAEITDLAVNGENQLLASSSCDTMIRVWCLQTGRPIAILSGHSAIVTSIQFCASSLNERFLISTGCDARVCFWSFDAQSMEFNSKPFKCVEKTRAGVSILCSSISVGSLFLATGSSDHVVRVYSLMHCIPEKIAELEAHTAEVDSIMFAHHLPKFISACKGGRVCVWEYLYQDWRSVILQREDKNLYVTIVAWTLDDRKVLAAYEDFSICLWDVRSCSMLHALKRHTGEAYLMEVNPYFDDVLMSAGHDGLIILWQLSTGKVITVFENNISGQGNAACFDCKWNANGMSLAVTDSHGFVIIYSFGDGEAFKKIPAEMFFHTDYRPLILDSFHFALDEQTQLSPHLMPPPYLVDMEGTPYPSELQRLVPGRENLPDRLQVPEIIVTDDGERQVRSERSWPQITENEEEGTHSELDAAIAQLQSTLLLDNVSSSHEGAQPSAVHSSYNNSSSSSSQDTLTEGQDKINDLQFLIPALDAKAVKQYHESINAAQEREFKIFQEERSKEPTQNSKMLQGRLARTRKGTVRKGKRAERLSNVSNTAPIRNRLTMRALYDTDENLSFNGTAQSDTPAESSALRNSLSPSSSGSSTSKLGISSSSSSEASSLDDDSYEIFSSDWNKRSRKYVNPPTRKSQRQRRVKRYSSSTSEDEDDSDLIKPRVSRNRATPDEDNSCIIKPRVSRNRAIPDEDDSDSTIIDNKLERRVIAQVVRKHIKSKGKKNVRRVTDSWNNNEDSTEDEEAKQEESSFSPTDWLMDVVSRKSPYVPQIGDELLYFRQGHQLYLEAVIKNQLHFIKHKELPWVTHSDLREMEFVKIHSLRVVLTPIRMVHLRLKRLDSITNRPTECCFSLIYHDMKDVIDFLVLKKMFDVAKKRNWKTGDRFRSIIDDDWWKGTIISQSPLSPDFSDSWFLCLNVRWDGGEEERVSPWDLEPLPSDDLDVSAESSLVTEEELKSILYQPRLKEWNGIDRSILGPQLAESISEIMQMDVAKHFNTPVDLNAYPDYAQEIAYPMDLSTIKHRLENDYYRRIASVEYDLRCILTNASSYNKPHSQIVCDARVLFKTCKKLLMAKQNKSVSQLYNETLEQEKRSLKIGQEQEKLSNEAKALKSSTWSDDCSDLLHVLGRKDFSVPFREAVDANDYPTYYQKISCPMYLQKISEKLEQKKYSDPRKFSADVKLIVNNSRTFNTQKKSQIYTMTVNFANFFESQFKHILADWEAWKYKEKRGRLPPDFQRQYKHSNSENLQSGQSRVKRPIRPMFSPQPGTSRSDQNHNNSFIMTKQLNGEVPANGVNLSGSETEIEDDKFCPKPKGFSGLRKIKSRNRVSGRKRKASSRYHSSSDDAPKMKSSQQMRQSSKENNLRFLDERNEKRTSVKINGHFSDISKYKSHIYRSESEEDQSKNGCYDDETENESSQQFESARSNLSRRTKICRRGSVKLYDEGSDSSNSTADECVQSSYANKSLSNDIKNCNSSSTRARRKRGSNGDGNLFHAEKVFFVRHDAADDDVRKQVEISSRGRTIKRKGFLDM